MSKYHIASIAFCVAIAATPAVAAAKKKSTQGIGSIQEACLKEVGAQYRPEEKRWYFYSPVGTAQWSAFYDCLDRHTMKR
jgi:hypothetical protein